MFAKSARTAAYKACGAETAEEIVGVLTAISVVSKRMARKVALLENSRARKDGDKNDAKSKRLPRDAD